MSHRNKKSSGWKRFFLLLNFLVAILFTLGCHVKWFDPVRFWFIGLLAVSATYLLLILVLFFIGWLFVKPLWSFIFILVIAVSWQPISNIIPLRLPQTFDLKKQDNSLRIMSWNVEQFEVFHASANPTPRKEMFQLINSFQPDIACFQEMVCSDSKIDSSTAYYRKYGYYALTDFTQQLHFPYYSYAYNPKLDFLYHEHFGIMILSKYPLINKHIISYAPHDYNSIFEYADMVKGEDTFRIFNIHLQSLRFTIQNLEYIDSPSLESHQDIESSKSVIEKFKAGFLKRHIQAERIKEEMNKSPYPIILCGDFNDVPNSYAYETIGDGLQNAFAQKGTGIGRTFSGISSTLRIDNIFLDPHFSVTQFTHIPKRLSDHFPIITDAVFNPQ